MEKLTPAQEAGRKGGKATAERYGHEFFEKIGRMSGGKFVVGGYRAKDSKPRP